jgi:hypothetical protein
MSSYESTIADLMEKLMGMPGIVDAILLPQDLRKEILAREQAEECDAKGFFAKYNAGLREVLKRDFIISILTNEHYTYPPEPVELICFGETVGEEIKDKSRLKELASDSNNMVLGDSFVIYKNKLPRDSLRKALSGEIKIIIPPMSVGLKDIKNVYGLVLAMPSTNTDVFLKEWLSCQGVDVLNKKLGAVLVGFNIIG